MSKHRAEVIELYPEQNLAAVKFRYNGKDRIEVVSLNVGPITRPLTVGQRGWMTYTLTPSRGVWGFDPFKDGGLK